MTTALMAECEARVTSPLHWLHFQRPRPELSGLTAVELLERTASLPGSLRYGAAGGNVLLLGELRLSPADDVEERVTELEHAPHARNGDRPEGVLSMEIIQTALEETGLAWKQRDNGWALPASATLPREIILAPEGGGLRVQATLLEWDEGGDTEHRAIAHLLCRAQLGLRFARCQLRPGQAVVTADIEQHFAEALADSIGGVAAGARLLAREVAALLESGAAQAFLEFLAGPIENAGPTRA
jgi:hypothetical protein